MELSDYISLTLTEIAKGVKKANESKGDGSVLVSTPNDVNGIPYTWGKEQGNLIRRPIIRVGFRVGLELDESEKSNNKIGGSLKVISVGHESMTIDDKKSVHEVSFELPFVL